MAQLGLAQLLDCWTVVPVTRALVKLGVPDAVPVRGFVRLDAVAASIGAETQMLKRSIRYVAGFGVFEEHPDDQISHTETSLRLREGGSLRNKVLYRASAEMVMPYVEGFESLLRDSSKSAFEHLHNQDYFTEWLSQRPASEGLFAQYMTEASSLQLPAILECCPWPNSGTVADIGGGNGHLLQALLRRHPGVSGVLFDLSSTASRAEHLWPGDLRGRTTFASGDFFQAVDVSADVYVLKWILHDWRDDRCVQLLSNIGRSAHAGSAVIIIDMLVPEDLPNQYHISKFYDVHMAAGYGGKERTLLQFAALASAAGWVLAETKQIVGTPFSCLVLGLPRSE